MPRRHELPELIGPVELAHLNDEPRLTIDTFGALLVEAWANGLTKIEIADLFGVSEGTINNHAGDLYDDLGIKSTEENRSMMRGKAVAMSIEAGLLTTCDLKRPGTEYTTTICPDENSKIDVTRKSTRLTSQKVVAPKDGCVVLSRGTAITMTSSGEYKPREKTFTPVARTFLSCLAWAVPRVEIAKRFTPREYSEAKALKYVNSMIDRTIEGLDARHAPQAIAHAALWGVIELEEAILDAKAEPAPTVYTEKFTVPSEVFAKRRPENWQPISML